MVVYSASEIVHFNGPCIIVTYALIFKHYGWYNLSIKGVLMTKGTIKNLAFMSEILMFIFLGLNLNKVEPGKNKS